MSFLGEGARRAEGVSMGYWALRKITPKSLRKNFLILI